MTLDMALLSIILIGAAVLFSLDIMPVDRLSVLITTDASWLPTFAEFVITVIVEM